MSWRTTTVQAVRAWQVLGHRWGDSAGALRLTGDDSTVGLVARIGLRSTARVVRGTVRFPLPSQDALASRARTSSAFSQFRSQVSFLDQVLEHDLLSVRPGPLPWSEGGFFQAPDSAQWKQKLGVTCATVDINGQYTFNLEGRTVTFQKQEGVTYQPADLRTVVEAELKRAG